MGGREGNELSQYEASSKGREAKWEQDLDQAVPISRTTKGGDTDHARACVPSIKGLRKRVHHVEMQQRQFSGRSKKKPRGGEEVHGKKDVTDKSFWPGLRGRKFS